MSDGVTQAGLGNVDGSYPYATFKNDIGAALVGYFGAATVTRGNKAFDVHANSYRIDADVVPAFEHRRYYGNALSNWHETPPGMELHPDKGGSVINWPRQNYSNGVTKNDATERSFKSTVRIIKNLRNEMVGARSKQRSRSPPISSSAWSTTFPTRCSINCRSRLTCAARSPTFGTTRGPMNSARRGSK